MAGVSLNIGTAKTLTSSTTSNIKQGKVTWDGNKTLTLENVRIERTGSTNRAIQNKSVSGLTVVLKGTNYLKATGASPVRFNAQTTLKCEAYNGTKSTTIVGGSQDALTVGSGVTLTITDANLTLESTSSSAFDAENSPTLIIQNSTITAKGSGSSSNDNYGLNNYKLLKIYDSKVTLEGTSQAIKNLTTLTLGTGMYIETPAGGSFNSTSKTVVSSTGSIAKQVVFNTGINITNNFPDTNFRSWVSTNCDTNNDGYLLPAEISRIQVMNVSSRSIKSLTGVEFFTALTQLICNNNSLETLDVSKNTKLTNIDCGINKLSTLNLSNNKALKMIQCYHNQIRGNGVATFLSNLPTVTGGEIHFYALDSSTGNAMTAAQVATAKGKGWTVMWQKTAGATWTVYPGSDAIAIDATNFPDDNFRSYVSSNCDPNKDGCLTPTELKSIKSMDVSSKSIKKLNGIEYFTSLTELICYNCGLTSLDVSKNTALTTLWCERNNLVTLDVQKNTALTTLRFGNNELTTIDLSKNTALTWLECFENALATLDVSKNTLLTALYCYSNKLKSLVVSKNSALKYLHCFDNQLQGTSMDQLIAGLPETGGKFYAVAPNMPNEQNVVTTAQVAAAKAKGWTTYYKQGAVVDITINDYWEYAGSDAMAIGVTNFPDANFRNWLLAQDYGKDGFLTPAELKDIHYMDVSSKSIKKLNGIEYFTALTELICYNNELTSLDVSKNTALTTLWCERNNLVTLDVQKNTALTTLRFGNNELTTIDLSKNTALTWLECFENALATLDVSKNTLLTALYCYSNKLKSLVVSKNSALKYLHCFDNQLQGTSMDQLIAGLPETGGKFYAVAPNMPNEQNVVTTAQVAAAKAKGWTTYYKQGAVVDITINDYWEYDGSPVGLAINATNFPDETFRNWLLAQEYGKDGVLTDEEIAGVKEIDVNGFVTGGTVASLKGIEHFTALTTLNCYFNQISALDVSKNTALTTLLIGDNPLKAMPDLSQNTKLTILDCSSLVLTKLDVSKLTALTELSCGGNLLKELDLEKLTALTTLNIENNQFETLDVSHNTALTSLNCTNNRLTTIDLSKNKSLNTLFCSVNRISGTGMTALVNSLPVISWTAPSGKIYVVDETNKSEYNVCSTVQRAIATSKRWSVYHNNTGLWELYAGSAVVKGDANGDGIIDANDVDALTNYILTGTLPPYVDNTDALDVDGSGTVDIVDLTRLIRLTFGR